MYSIFQAFKTKKLLHRHMQQFHKLTEPKLDCPYVGCRLSFYKASELDRHYATHTSKLIQKLFPISSWVEPDRFFPCEPESWNSRPNDFLLRSKPSEKENICL